MNVHAAQDLLRVGVISPAGKLLACALTSVEEGSHLHATVVDGMGEMSGGDQIDGVAGIDVALVSTCWPATGAWRSSAPFDVMDAVEAAAAVTAAPVVLFGEQWGGPEFVIEAMGHAAVAGRVRAGIDPGELADVLIAVARRERHPGLVVEESRVGMHGVLEGNRLLASLSCAVAGRGATTWIEIARMSGFSVRTVQASPARFAPLIRADLGLPADHDVTQALLFHWLGTKAEYVRSWCRRRAGDAPFR